MGAALTITGLVTFIAAYHYIRIFDSWVEAYDFPAAAANYYGQAVQRCIPLHGLATHRATLTHRDRAVHEDAGGRDCNDGDKAGRRIWPHDHPRISGRAHHRRGLSLHSLGLLGPRYDTFSLRRAHPAHRPQVCDRVGVGSSGQVAAEQRVLGDGYLMVHLPHRLYHPNVWRLG